MDLGHTTSESADSDDSEGPAYDKWFLFLAVGVVILVFKVSRILV